MQLLAIDPGLTCTGWALAESGLFLKVGVAYLTEKQKQGMSLFQRSRRLASMLPKCNDGALIEHMWVSRKQAANANNLLKTAFLSGYYASRYSSVEMVFPSQWQPKDYPDGKAGTESWVRDTIGATRSDSLVGHIPRSKRDNAYDAMGMAIFYANREGLRAR